MVCFGAGREVSMLPVGDEQRQVREWSKERVRVGTGEVERERYEVEAVWVSWVVL